jgi:hypothetical protein
MPEVIDPGPQPQSSTENPGSRYGAKKLPCDSSVRFAMKSAAFGLWPGVYVSDFIGLPDTTIVDVTTEPMLCR